MTDTDHDQPPAFGAGTTLQFNSPLSTERATTIIATLAQAEPQTMLDLGCGWGELLLRAAEAIEPAQGLGIDVHQPDIERARAAAAARGLADRVRFETGDAAEKLRSADLVICSGAYQAFGDIPAALAHLRQVVNPGGRLLFAAEFWETPPSEQELAHMWPGTTAQDCLDLAGLVDAATSAGFRPLAIHTANLDEWDEFECGQLAEPEAWLARHRDHPRAEEVRQRCDEMRSHWLRGHRRVMGYAHLILA